MPLVGRRFVTAHRAEDRFVLDERSPVIVENLKCEQAGLNRALPVEITLGVRLDGHGYPGFTLQSSDLKEQVLEHAIRLPT
ncbi:MAG: hypothetical protein ACR2OU_09520 [Thermomicrobiales bacterium]